MDIQIFKGYFSSEECQFLLSFPKEFRKSGISIRGVDTFSDYRTSEDSASSNQELKLFLLSKLSSLNLISIPSVGYIKYVKGSKFGLHRDRDDLKGVYTSRYKTLLIQLSKSSDYVGGNLIIENRFMPRSLGSVVMFNSKYLHEVTEVTQGTRYSLCLFLEQSDFKSSII